MGLAATKEEYNYVIIKNRFLTIRMPFLERSDQRFYIIFVNLPQYRSSVYI